LNLSFYIWILLPELISSPNLPNPALLYQLYHIGVNLFLKVWRINNILLLFCLKLKKYLVKLQQHKDKNTLSEIHSPHDCLSNCWCIKFATGLNIIIAIVQKVYEWPGWYFAKLILLSSFWQKDSLITFGIKVRIFWEGHNIWKKIFHLKF